MKLLPTWKTVHHTGHHGQRYTVDRSKQAFLKGLLERGRRRVFDYTDFAKQSGSKNNDIGRSANNGASTAAAAADPSLSHTKNLIHDQTTHSYHA